MSRHVRGCVLMRCPPGVEKCLDGGRRLERDFRTSLACLRPTDINASEMLIVHVLYALVRRVGSGAPCQLRFVFPPSLGRLM